MNTATRYLPDHAHHVAAWLGKVFGGPATYTTDRGGYPTMLRHHLGLAITPEQCARWAQLIAEATDEAGLPADAEFRSAFVAYVEWGSRIAMENSQLGATPSPRAPFPAGAGEKPHPTRVDNDIPRITRLWRVREAIGRQPS